MRINRSIVEKCIVYQLDPARIEEEKIHHSEQVAREKGWLPAGEYRPKCPKCFHEMEFDPGDGFVHEAIWFCIEAKCHYNSREFLTVGFAVGLKMAQDGKSDDEIRAEIKRLHGEQLDTEVYRPAAKK